MNSSETSDPSFASDAKSSASVNALRDQLMAVQEKLLQLREKEIWDLRERVSSVNSRVSLISTVAAIAVATLSFFGFKEMKDIQQIPKHLEDKINSSIQSTLETKIGYQEKLLHAQILWSGQHYADAEESYRELFKQKPRDEIVFIYLVDCLEKQDNVEGALAVVDEAKKEGLFPHKCYHMWSFANAAWAVLMNNLDKPAELRPALSWLKKAQSIAEAQDDRDKIETYKYLTYCYAAMGDMNNMQEYARRYTEAQPGFEDPDKDFWSDFDSEDGRQRLEKLKQLRQKEMAELQRIFPVKDGSDSQSAQARQSKSKKESKRK